MYGWKFSVLIMNTVYLGKIRHFTCIFQSALSHELNMTVQKSWPYSLLKFHFLSFDREGHSWFYYWCTFFLFYLYHSLGKFSRCQINIFSYFFPQKIGFDISCNVSCKLSHEEGDNMHEFEMSKHFFTRNVWKIFQIVVYWIFYTAS